MALWSNLSSHLTARTQGSRDAILHDAKQDMLTPAPAHHIRTCTASSPSFPSYSNFLLYYSTFSSPFPYSPSSFISLYFRHPSPSPVFVLPCLITYPLFVLFFSARSFLYLRCIFFFREQLAVHFPTFYLFLCLSVCLSICPPIHLYAYLYSLTCPPSCPPLYFYRCFISSVPL